MRIIKNLIRKTAFAMLVLAVTATIMPFSAHAQEASITLPSGNITAREVFDAINTQTPYKVTVNRSRIDDSYIVKINRSPMQVSAVLIRLLEGTGYTYAMNGDIILLPVTATEAAAAKSTVPVTVNAVRRLAGTVSGEANGLPLENIAVEILGTSKRATTNSQGRFLIEEVPSGSQIVKLTSDDGSIRFREITVAAASDTDVKLTFGGELLTATKQDTDSTINQPRPVKTTAYYVQTPTDNTIRAFTDEPKAQFTYIPSEQVGDDYLPKAAIKTNLLYLATTSLNLGAEFGIARKWTFDIAAGINTWDLNSRKGGIRHWLVQPEVRYWFCQRFEKHFIGVHALGGQYQIANINLKPFGNDLTGKRYDGYAVGAGVSYGYHLPVAKRWAFEFSVGVGYLYLDYDKYNCGECDNKIGSRQKHYFGPTKLGASLIFMIK